MHRTTGADTHTPLRPHGPMRRRSGGCSPPGSRIPRFRRAGIEESLAPFNTVEHERVTAPLVAAALRELPKLKRERKIFFVNNWLAAFLGGQTSPEALATAKRFLREAKLDPDLRRKVLEELAGLERTVRIRRKYG
jgi:hypothetical protein